MFKKATILIILLLLSTTSWASLAMVNGVRMWASPESTRLVIDLSRSVEHRVTRLTHPERLVIDIEKAELLKPIDGINYSPSSISEIRSAQKKDNSLRLVLDLKREIQPKSFLLKPNANYGYRLVIDLNEKEPDAQASSPKIIKSVNSSERKDIVVAIDAGHGGDDPGAIGKRGTKEKHIVLKIARRLEKLVNSKPGMRAVMIRNGDYYISLRGRTEKARKANADIFISIHADAFKNSKARGSSVFILSQRGASSEAARWLAKKENDADLVGGVSLDDKDDVLARLLLDLSQTATIEASNTVASIVMRDLKKVGKTHKKHVERAGFAVLKSPDIPSILVETGFISNAKEEYLLKTSSYQTKVAKAIFAGVDSYFKRFPIPGTVYARETVVKPLNLQASENTKHIKHKVIRGDTLSALAKKYQVTVKAIKSANSLKNSTLFVGKTITIPGT